MKMYKLWAKNNCEQSGNWNRAGTKGGALVSTVVYLVEHVQYCEEGSPYSLLHLFNILR